MALFFSSTLWKDPRLRHQDVRAPVQTCMRCLRQVTSTPQATVSMFICWSYEVRGGAERESMPSSTCPVRLWLCLWQLWKELCHFTVAWLHLWDSGSKVEGHRCEIFVLAFSWKCRLHKGLSSMLVDSVRCAASRANWLCVAFIELRCVLCAHRTWRTDRTPVGWSLWQTRPPDCHRGLLNWGLLTSRRNYPPHQFLSLVH